MKSEGGSGKAAFDELRRGKVGMWKGAFDELRRGKVGMRKSEK